MSSPMLDTDQLRSFLAIVDTGSFTRAAERVHKTQSAVSMHIKKLEERLGRPLFDKLGRGVRLSDDGEKLVDYARRMLQLEASAVAAISNKGLTGHVRLGIPDDYADNFLPLILTRFTRRHPLVDVSIICDSSLSLNEQLHLGQLDIAVVTDCQRLSHVEILREEPLNWIAGPHGSPHAERPLPLALGRTTCNWRGAALEALGKASIPARLILASNNYAAIAPMVQAGLAITVLPTSAFRPWQRVVGAREGLPALPPCRIGFIAAPGEQTPEARALAETIRASLENRQPGEIGEGLRPMAA
ncbi:MAG: LysR family transcriptional regulator [Hyphomicrobiales bacterium]|nr:LysR family transcriptional regulator [Hyphomicrobiales bacterium]